jgi:hypothetical protein
MNVKRILTGLASIVLAAGLAGGLASSAQASVAGISGARAAAAVTRVPVVYGVPYGHARSNFVDGKVRPTGILTWTGDGSSWFVIRSYSSWSSSNAWGSATVHVRSCWGSCFRYKTEHTTLHFYRVRTHNGHPYFTRLHFFLRHKVAGLGSSTLKFYSHGLPAWYY